MGFLPHWITLIQTCLQSISYSILVNGETQESFLPSRGLRQGDPLSPYLFILCAEALTALLNQAEACGGLTPVPIGRSSISVNHLFFVDDSLLFCQAKAEELSHVLNILDIYEKASGQVINKDKSSIFFSRNTGQAAQQQILELTGVKSSGTLERYLGLPALVGRAKVASFHTLIDRTWSRVSNWKNKFLFVAGKEVLLKAVLQAIPTYAMGLIWRVGNGQHVNIWSAKWLPFSPPYKIQSIREVDCWCEKVCDLIDPQMQQWKEPLLQELFTQQEITDIKSIPINMRGREDKLVWQFTTNGLYTVKSGYHLSKVLECAQEGETLSKEKEKQAWKTIWKLRVTPATKMFLWRACNEALPTLANLRRRKVVEHSSCLTCKQEAETSGHVLWGCIAAKEVWGQGVKKVQKLSVQSDLIFDI
ncbi:hypothetical protein F2P56_012970 [Juglans regia]|uniref:Reverse transcriptase domain-containing protein n=2 Tax=Juglans regia TaxID=51240 RepID=A0A833XJC4_JUGRE|nr:uncharacterized protein LOC108980830 [Juglans regia]KAF5468857.1 hypothetical protein F2P56_012970 [Juglans regia]